MRPKKELHLLLLALVVTLSLSNINGQTTCKNGLGRVLYERLPNQQLQGYDDDVVRDTAPPFRVLEKCQDLCLRDRSGSNNLVRTCTSFDFQPGSRITSFGGNSEYEESLCYLTSEQAGPEGIGSLMLVPNSVHFNEICLTSSRPERECPSRRYVFERHPRKKLKLPISDIKEITAANRSDCEDKCLNEFSFVCRSANFDSTMRSCTLSRFTRRTHPELMEDDPNSDYLENTCLNAERRCDGLAVFVKEENKRLGGPFEVDIFNNMTLEECQTMCLRAEKYFCRSVEFDDQSKQCILSEEDSISQKDDISISSSPTHHFYDLVCLDNQRANDYPDNSVTSHLFSSGRRPDTAFQRYRNSRLGGEFHSEITGRSLSECLDECLRQTSFQCRSAVYSDRFRTCRLSRYNQKDGMRIIYDADYDYYENLMLNVVGGGADGDGGGHSGGSDGKRPGDQSGSNWRQPNKHDDRYGSSGSTGGGVGSGSHGGTGSGGSRLPPGEGVDYNRPYDRYPDFAGNEYDRNPYGGAGADRDRDRYPPDRYGSRYPAGGDQMGYGRPYDRFPDDYGLERPPPPFYDYDYEERYGDRYGPYDREYDGPPGRRPPSGGPYGRYDTPFNRPYGGNGLDDRPLPLPGLGLSHPPTPYGGGGGGGGGHVGIGIGVNSGPPRPPITRCEESDNFKQIAARHKMRRHFVRRALTVPSLIQCERECIESRDFVCRSFNYRDSAASSYEDRDRDRDRESPNCELSDRDSRELDIHDPGTFDASNYDFYERSIGRSDGECMDVTQTCNEEGMEFTIRTPEGFLGRIYTYGFYDRCFFRGNGGTVNVLRLSGPQGYPDCGTQRYGDTLTNIVVVQFSDNVQTSRDKRYNLTCIFRGPGEAVVSSGYIGAGSGSPIPIEYLPAENTLSSKVRLSILYQGRPTTTIAVGDPLTFRLEAQDGYNHVTDIFATNVVARDPYSGRSIQLIDRFGCPVDPFVFPELDKLRDGDTLEARFNAFKIPESNFLVFEATVRSCREGCQPAYCPGPAGRQEPSFGRRRRSLNTTEEPEPEALALGGSSQLEASTVDEVTVVNSTTVSATLGQAPVNETQTGDKTKETEEPEQVREMIEVFETREEIEKESYPRKLVAPVETVCMTPAEYHGLITAIILLMILLFSITMVAGLGYRRYWKSISKNRLVDRHSPIHSLGHSHSSIRTHERFTEIGHMPNLNGGGGGAGGAGGTGGGANQSASNRASNAFRTNMSMFGGSLHKTFATGNLARMCQLPVINPMRSNNQSGPHQFEDPSEPIYTDPSLFERSRQVLAIHTPISGSKNMCSPFIAICLSRRHLVTRVCRCRGPPCCKVHPVRRLFGSLYCTSRLATGTGQ
ncbi:uncharacterized protein LOC128254089 isoform X3 [Drosophila gunungcola]|uniref:uncharacterized protein LOC128254089 isoform X3 n=1 Tax=Drosophila gunungcola TaxID=103775 RepID=UPI0022E41000|nr:uncharacterized protein LOC128254089 isoform X3 [Drosophila gunungcola]